MKEIIQDINQLKLNEGEVLFGQMPIGELPDSSEINMPLIIGQGKKGGPTLLLTALIHGIEIGGYEAIRKVFEEVDFNKVNGRIIAVPIVNPLSFNMANRYTPQDSADLNRSFPGGPKGTISQKIAHILSEKIARHADYAIDFHSCNPPSEFFTIVNGSGNKKIQNTSWEMAKAFGAVTVAAPVDGIGTFSDTLADMGIPSITPELTFSRRFNSSSDVAKNGTINVMQHLGMIKGEMKTLLNVLPFKERLKYAIYNIDCGGFVHFKKNVGDAVNKNEVFAEVRNPWGEIKSELLAPVSGVVIAYPMGGNQAISTGDKIAYFAHKE